jgi:hypothetical protein
MLPVSNAASKARKLASRTLPLLLITLILAINFYWVIVNSRFHTQNREVFGTETYSPSLGYITLKYKEIPRFITPFFVRAMRQDMTP